MKKTTRNKLVITLVSGFLILNLTGCTKQLKNEQGKIVKNNETGQALTKNILCKPTDKETLQLYEDYNKQASEKNKINLDGLDNCQDMKLVGGKYDGIWTSLFVKPLAWVIIKIGNLLNTYGLALILTTILIRLIAWPFTKSGAMQSENLKKAKPELDKLEKKYKDKSDQESQIQKSQEMFAIYKKYGVKPLSGCLFQFIQIPLFFAFYEGISRIPAIFDETFLGFQLGTSPLTAALQGHYYYLILIIFIVSTTYYSFNLNSGAAMSADQEKQMKTMKNFMTIFMTFAAFSISSGIAIYWVVSSLMSIAQNLWVKRGMKHD